MNESSFTQAKDPVSGRFLPGPKGKGNLKHGVTIFLQTGKLPSVRGKRLLNKYLRALERDLRAALGGSPTPQEDIMVRQVLRAEGVLRLIEIWLQKVPAINGKAWKRGSLELQPCLSQSYGFFLNVQRQAVLALGLNGRQASEVMDLNKYIAARDAEKAQLQAGQGEGDGVSNKAEGGEKSPPASTSRKGQGKASRARVEGGGQVPGDGIAPGPAREGGVKEGSDE